MHLLHFIFICFGIRHNFGFISSPFFADGLKEAGQSWLCLRGSLRRGLCFLRRRSLQKSLWAAVGYEGGWLQPSGGGGGAAAPQFWHRKEHRKKIPEARQESKCLSETYPLKQTVSKTNKAQQTKLDCKDLFNLTQMMPSNHFLS